MTPLLLLPGHMCDRRLWSALDLGTRPSRHADLAADDRVEAMASRVLAAAPPRFVACGFSMGGIVAMQLAARAGERLAGLVLLDTNAGPDLPERSAARLRQQAEVRAGGLRRVVAEELKPTYLAPANRGRQDLLDLTMAMAEALGADAFCRQSEALRTRPDARPLLPAIAAPTMVACGEDDPLCPPAWHDAIVAALPNARLAVVPGAGHLLPLEQPAALSALLNDFLNDIDRGAA